MMFPCNTKVSLTHYSQFWENPKLDHWWCRDRSFELYRDTDRYLTRCPNCVFQSGNTKWSWVLLALSIQGNYYSVYLCRNVMHTEGIYEPNPDTIHVQNSLKTVEILYKKVRVSSETWPAKFLHSPNININVPYTQIHSGYLWQGS